jgi:hypothetical protein
VLKNLGRSYHFPPGSTIPAGATMRVTSVAEPEFDTPSEKGWGRVGPILRDAGGSVRLQTYADITLACAAWGDGTCAR